MLKKIPAALLLISACSGAPDPPSQNDTSPETVVVLIACTMRADRLHVYGNERQTSPYIDKLAAGGARFERALTSAPWTRPGVAALVTGRYPLAIGIDDPGNATNTDRGLHPDIDTMAERFRAAGWATAGAVANPNANAVYNFDQGFDTYYEAGGLWRDGFHKADGVGVVDAWLSEVAGVEGPLFGQILVIDTHAPLAQLRERRARLGLNPVGDGTMLERYDASVTVLDDVIRRLDEGLAKMGRQDRLLVFVADHSEGLMTPPWAGPAHGRRLYEANLHVPWIIHGGEAARGHVISGLSTSVDVLPTVLELVGLPLTGTIDGTSRADAVRGESAETSATSVFSETRYANEHMARLTTDDWIYIYNYNSGESGLRRGRQELYPTSDTIQKSNVVSLHPQVVADLFGQLETLREEVEDGAIYWERSMSDADRAELNRQLEALGYIETETPDETPDEFPEPAQQLE